MTSNENQPSILLAGSTRSGKTTYLATLIVALMERGWTVEYSALSSESDPIARRKRFIDAGYYPPPTAIEESPEPIRLIVSRRQSKLDIILLDPAGEVFQVGEGKNPAKEETIRNLRANVIDCRGIIFLVDPVQPPEFAATSWTNMLRLLGSLHDPNSALSGQPRRPINAAVIITKADSVPWQQRWRMQNAQAWIENSLGLAKLVNLVTSQVANVRFCFSSSIGWRGGTANKRRVFLPLRIDDPRQAEAALRAKIFQILPSPLAFAIEKDGHLEIRQERDKSPTSRREPLAASSFLSDPSSVVEEDLNRQLMSGAIPIGVHERPGRRDLKSGAGSASRPWNVVEPFLWVAGLQ